MKKNYLKALLGVALFSVTTLAGAVAYPTYPTQELKDGGKYILCNLANPTGYMARTSWDGAYYFLGETDSKYQEREITAHYDAENSRWFFTTSETYHEAVEADEATGVEAQEAYTSYTYFGVPNGTDNVNGNLTEEAYWTVTPGITSGFYYLTAGDGQGNPQVIGLNMHLNSGGQYWVISEPTNGWYPDFYGGIQCEEDGTDKVIYDEATDTYYKVMADSTSMNWAFVNVEDVPAYVEVGTQWAKLNNFEKNYCSIEGYEDGFKATLAAAQAAFDTKDYESMQAIIDAKVNLYTQLVKAKETEAEGKLDAAIAAAEEAFKTKTAADEVAAAYETLKKACDDFAQGLGDITSMGQNMSFEDLSAQNGQTTTGVAAAPTGWNVYINDVKAETAADVNKKIYNWHGVNGDCTGDIKDGNYGFGIWTSSVPDYEISQTITGLDNGAYTIKCGLMVGANGNGSRRTTQRVFGNLSSTYFASEGEYDASELDATELSGYANLQEPVTDTEMQEISVQTYVYDGTLTFGIRTDGNYKAALRDAANSAGGDGWFKCDNFTISKDGENHDLAYLTAQKCSDVYSTFGEQPMPQSMKELADSLSDAHAVSSSMSDAELEAAIISAQQDNDKLAGISAGINAYKTLKEAIDQAYERRDACDEQGYKGVDDFSDAIDEVNGKYEDGTYETADVEGVVTALDSAYQVCLHSGVDEGADVSDLIVNRSFEDLSNQGGANSDGTVNAPAGWTLKLNGVECKTADEIKAQGVNGWCAINSGDNINVTDEYGNVHSHQYTDGTHLWGIWNSTIPQVELSQTITGLNPGTYTLTADVMVRNTDWSGDNLTTQRIFANGVICLYGTDNDYIPEYLQNTTSDDVYQAYNLMVNESTKLDEENDYEYLNYANWDASSHDQLLRTLTLHFGVGENGIATIGFRTDNLDGWTGEAQTETAAGWFKLDNFTLYYESSQIPTKVETVNVANNASASRLYDLTGRQINKAQKGVYIQNGKKILK